MDAVTQFHREPQRMCVGCRGRGNWSAFLRVVAGEEPDGPSVLRPDPHRRLEGRGAWLHPSNACLELAIRRRAFGRALRLSREPDLAALVAFVIEQEQSVRTGTESGFDADEHPMSTQQ